MNDSTIDNTLPGDLKKIHWINKAITKVHLTINDHINKASIECFEEKVENVVDNVVCKVLWKNSAYIRKYNDDNVVTSDNVGPTDNTLISTPADIDRIYGR